MNSADFNPIFPREMLLCYIFRTSVAKYNILSNKRRNKHVISSQWTCEIHFRTSLNKTQTFLPHLWITTLLPCYEKMIFLLPIRTYRTDKRITSITVITAALCTKNSPHEYMLLLSQHSSHLREVLFLKSWKAKENKIINFHSRFLLFLLVSITDNLLIIINP